LQQNIKNISETEQELEIIFSAEEFAPEYAKELDEAKKSIQIKGLPQGTRPLSLIKNWQVLPLRQRLPKKWQQNISAPSLMKPK